jgi:hypothetical protein
MSKALSNVIGGAKRLWTRFNDFLMAHNDRQVEAWGASLQYKRRYTNPEAAKAYRRTL